MKFATEQKLPLLRGRAWSIESLSAAQKGIKQRADSDNEICLYF